MRGYSQCGRQLYTALRQGKWRRIYWVRRKELFMWECMHFYWMNTQNPNIWTHELLALGSWAALALFSSLLLRWPWRFLPGPHAFLRTSGSWRGAVAVITAAPGLGSSLRWEEPGADEDLDLIVCCWKAWLMALPRFWASTKGSIMDSTTSPKRLEGVIVAFSSTWWSASLRSARFSQRCLWRTIINP